MSLIERCSISKISDVDEYRITRRRAVSIIFPKIWRGWSDLNGRIYGSAASLWYTDVVSIPVWFSIKTSRNGRLVPIWRVNLILGWKLLASFNMALRVSNDSFEVKKISSIYLETRHKIHLIMTNFDKEKRWKRTWHIFH